MIGAERAAALYVCALNDTLVLIAGYADSKPVISYAPPDSDARRFFATFAPAFTLIPQHGATFGERLFSAFAQLAERGANNMVLIGTDNPSLPRSHIEAAFAALDEPETDAVLGRTSDGGYYLIGMRRPHPILFERITWGTERVADETRARAAEANLRLVEVAPWYDLDTYDDLRTLLNDVTQAGDGRAPRTRAFIEVELTTPAEFHQLS